MIMIQPLLGILVFVGLAWLLSEDRRAVLWKYVVLGLGIQLALALVLTYVPAIQDFFALLTDGIRALDAATRQGTSFVFGYIGGGASPFEATGEGSTFILAFQSLPLILVIGALSAVLWHWKVLIYLVRGAAWLVVKAFRVGGAVGVSSGANIFMGMVESPLLIKPFLPTLTRSELFAVMACGMATISGTMMVLYGSILDPHMPGAFGHLLIASVINAPAALMLAKVIVPDDHVTGADQISLKSSYGSTLDAITSGTADAVRLLANIIALLVVFIALIALIDSALSLIPADNGPWTLRGMLGTVMAPVAWLVGVPWSEAAAAGGLMGTKIISTEFIAYLDLINLPAEALSDRSRFLMTYALCSFANFVSLAIIIGGLSVMAPERSKEVISLGFRSLIAGVFAGNITACMMGLITAL